MGEKTPEIIGKPPKTELPPPKSGPTPSQISALGGAAIRGSQL
jgi:hypothetical protein